MAGRRLSDQEFLSLLAAPRAPPAWDLDAAGRFLLLPLAPDDLAWVAECCGDAAEGEHHVLGAEALVFARGRDLLFARYLAL
jgi:hypothetical protein